MVRSAPFGQLSSTPLHREGELFISNYFFSYVPRGRVTNMIVVVLLSMRHPKPHSTCFTTVFARRFKHVHPLQGRPSSPWMIEVCCFSGTTLRTPLIAFTCGELGQMKVFEPCRFCNCPPIAECLSALPTNAAQPRSCALLASERLKAGQAIPSLL
jgi:hypothetical protein